MGKILMIGIAGGTGSGKTTLMKNLVERFGDAVTVVSHDNYYKRHDDMTYEERCLINYDEPAAFENDLMARQLEALRRGERVECPVYDYTVHNRSNETADGTLSIKTSILSPAAAYEVNLNEDRLRELSLNGDTLSFSLRGNGLMTFEIEMTKK